MSGPRSADTSAPARKTAGKRERPKCWALLDFPPVRCGAFLVASMLVLVVGCTTDSGNEVQTPLPRTTTEAATAPTSGDVSAATYMPVSHDPHCLAYESLNYCFAIAPTVFGVGNMPVRKVTWQQWGAEVAVGRGEILTRSGSCAVGTSPFPRSSCGRSWYRAVKFAVSDPITCDGVRTYSHLRIYGEGALALPLRCPSS